MWGAHGKGGQSKVYAIVRRPANALIIVFLLVQVIMLNVEFYKFDTATVTSKCVL